MEKHIAQLTHEQRQLGHTVSIFFNQGKATSTDDSQLLPFFNLRKIRPQFLKDFIFYSAVIFFLIGREKKYDVIHVHGDWSAFLFTLVIKSILGKPRMIASIHGRIKSGKLWRLIYIHLLTRFNVVYTTGNNEAKLLSEYTETVVHWRNSGINQIFYADTLFDISTKIVDVISVANFYPIKNIKLIIEIASLLPQHNFELIGDGPLKNLLHAECLRRGIKNISFIGSLPQHAVAEHLKRAKIFLSTSFSEGTPTAMIEAMASGLAIVTSNSNNYEALVKNNHNGYIIENFIPEVYADCIKALILNEELLKSIQTININIAKQHSWPAVAKTITNWYSENNLQ